MTFGNFILRLRRRLQDLRQLSDGSPITLINQDGVRWSYLELLEIANYAIDETIRLVEQYSKSQLLRGISQSSYIVQGSGTTTSGGVLALSSNVLDVLGVSDGTNEYARVSPEKYSFYKNAAVEPLKSQYFFTIVFNTSTNVKNLLIIPATGSVALTYQYIYRKTDYGVEQSSTEVFLQGVDDLLIDVAEREARDREHNWARSQILDARIAVKLGGNIGKSV